MNCVCHGEPAYWVRDARLKKCGWWECGVDRRAKQRAQHHGPNSYWHRPGGGYVKRRKRMLANERERIAERLQQLEQEAREC